MGILRWLHYDSRGIGNAVADAYARAAARAWSHDDASRADFRALVLGALATMANLGTAKVRVVGERRDVVIDVQPSDRADKHVAQLILGSAIRAMVEGAHRATIQPLKRGQNVTLSTNDGAPGGSLADTGALPVMAWYAAVAVGGIVAAGTAMLLSQKSELEAARITSNHKVQVLAELLAAVSRILQAHHEREEREGRSIPFDKETVALLERLDAAIGDVSAFTPRPLASVPNVAALTEGLGELGKGAGKAMSKAADWVPLAVVGFLVWKFL